MKYLFGLLSCVFQEVRLTLNTFCISNGHIHEQGLVLFSNWEVVMNVA